ncbi:hypothetical protein BDI4_430104 [Burkholderia diffusa]|nr:hypothetical protein BDI4_430104 [Burkholderia diffusa]
MRVCHRRKMARTGLDRRDEMRSGVLVHARVIQSKRALPDAESMRWEMPAREMPAGQDGANAPHMTDGEARKDAERRTGDAAAVPVLHETGEVPRVTPRLSAPG